MWKGHFSSFNVRIRIRIIYKWPHNMLVEFAVGTAGHKLKWSVSTHRTTRTITKPQTFQTIKSSALLVMVKGEMLVSQCKIMCYYYSCMMQEKEVVTNDPFQRLKAKKCSYSIESLRNIFDIYLYNVFSLPSLYYFCLSKSFYFNAH